MSTSVDVVFVQSPAVALPAFHVAIDNILYKTTAACFSFRKSDHDNLGNLP